MLETAKATHRITDWKTYDTVCGAHKGKKPHEWPAGHDFTDEVQNATCVGCKPTRPAAS